jgi:hypothetical protein
LGGVFGLITPHNPKLGGSEVGYALRSGDPRDREIDEVPRSRGGPRSRVVEAGP